MISENPESYMFHHPNVEWTPLQAESMSIPIITKRTTGRKEEELKDLEDVLGELRPGIDGVVSGALASEYQKSRIDETCRKLGLKSLAPLWGMDPEEHWSNLLKAGFEVIMTAVACEGLGKEWLGRKVDGKALAELKRLSEKHRFNLAGEGGEFETFVLDCPLFRNRLDVIKADVIWKDDSGVYLIKKLALARK
jgi:predicted ATP pyrophosphatase (TIGR00289 family)